MRRSLTISGFRLWISDLMSSVFSVPPCETIYTANELNQYVSRTVPPTVSVIGSAPDTVDVYVNGTPADRQGPYWHSVVTVNNVPSPVYAEIEVLGVSTPVNPQDPPEYSISTNHLFVAQSPELFEYDLDGNLTKDGRFNYTWNGENRLVSVSTRPDLPLEVPRYRIDYAYDHRGRRIQKEVFDANNSKLKTVSFLYDKWNLIAEASVDYVAQTTNFISYVWGKDLSGKLQGAGGVGGLLTVIRDDEIYYPCYDANGNISEYIASDGTIAAHYEYDAFGNPVVEHSPLLKGGGGNAAGGLSFSFRFSTKYWDNETELYYYGYRYLKQGRWLNRDPIEERGGLNLYGFAGNDSINKTDYLGMDANTVNRASMEWGCCNGEIYMPSTHCCIDGKIYSKEKKKTGIKHCCGYDAVVNRHGAPKDYPYHCWVEYVDSAGNPRARGSYPHGLQDDAGNMAMPEIPPVPGVTDGPYTWKECIELETSECDYDTKAISACIERSPSRGNYIAIFNDCRYWSRDVFDICLLLNQRLGGTPFPKLGLAWPWSDRCSCK